MANSIEELNKKIERIEKLINGMYREVGAREGKELAKQVDSIERTVKDMKSEMDRIKIDTTHIRKIQEFGSKTDDEIKKALAAIYRNTDEIESSLIAPGERETK